MAEIIKLFESSNFIQKYVVENTIRINNYIGTPSYEVNIDINDIEEKCITNIILDHTRINGKIHLTCYLHIANTVILLYNDNPKHWVDPLLNDKFKNLEFVIQQFNRFNISKKGIANV